MIYETNKVHPEKNPLHFRKIQSSRVASVYSDRRRLDGYDLTELTSRFSKKLGRLRGSLFRSNGRAGGTNLFRRNPIPISSGVFCRRSTLLPPPEIRRRPAFPRFLHRTVIALAESRLRGSSENFREPKGGQRER